ncbi:hypothetical protein AGDE_12149 [Angomonas deanei]|nr:hypothetical protein AGDE_12149 [Angomonas deanei]|eukprot:EPY24833.1 hypothetical protein AGDE_12149 [Angomonas deanei]
MESPKTLNGYFLVVDDHFRKTFRDDCSLFLALKTFQVSQGVRAAADEEKAAKEKSESQIRNSFVLFSPRMIFKKDGTALGKVKISFGLDVPHVCDVEQKIMVDTEGAATGVLLVRNLVEGLLVKGRAQVNAIAPASQDVTGITLHYQPSDFYGSIGYQRNGLGSSNLLVDCGATFVNVLLGGGFERQQISFLEHEDGREQFDVMYAGVGFTGVNWSLGAKMTRTSDSWTSARLALLQRLSDSTAMACSYNFDMGESKAHATIGFMQGIRLRLPTFLIPKRGVSLPGDGSLNPDTLVPLVLACKGSSDGIFSTTVRGFFNQSLRWGLVARRNLLTENSPFQFGFTLSVEADS